MKRDTWFLFGILVILSVIFAARGFGGAADTPAIFSDGYTLAEARQISADTGKPIFALATADWCGPCQSLKRDALADPEVVAFLRARTIPVYIEESDGIEDIRALRVRAYPTSVLLDSEGVLGVIEGGAPPAEYLSLLKRSIGDAG